ncbi:MAG: DUF429 domain-containing protein [archaeon]|nr:DUF429 domain-containing protein [archaeon]
MLFVGIDLAWSPKNKSGIAVIKGDKEKGELICKDILCSDNDIVDYVTGEVNRKNALVAIDAPLTVPNREGRRVAEDITGMLFRKYNAGAYPANRTRLGQWSDGKIRGEEIVRLLEDTGFRHDPYIEKYEKTRNVFEVYPHPSMVVLFGLDRILRYKAKPKRDYEFRWNEFERFQDYLKKLDGAKPSLALPEELTEKNVRRLRGNALKDYEDLLDSVFCAYIAYYGWVNPDRCAILGNTKDGYIFTPVSDAMKLQLSENKDQP